MRELVKVLFAVLLAIQPLSTWTLLGAYGSDHALRLAMVDGGLNLVLVHFEDSAGYLNHHHTTADRLLVTSAGHDVGAGNHVIRSFQGDVTPPTRAANTTRLMIAPQGIVVQPRAESPALRLLDASLSHPPPPRAAPLLL